MNFFFSFTADVGHVPTLTEEVDDDDVPGNMPLLYTMIVIDFF